MRIGRIVLLACLMASFTHRAMAVPLAFDFSFLDLVTGNSVAGVVSGLQDDATTAASSVFVSTNSGGYGIGEYVGNPEYNTWTVSGGVIKTVEFLSLGWDNSEPAVVCCSLLMLVKPGGPFSLPPTNKGSLSPRNNGGTVSESSAITFKSIEPEVVPIPSALALLGVGLFGLVVSRRKRKLDI